MDTFPDLGSLTDQELKDLIKQLTEEEMEVSYRRRILHGKIDILRAELVNRLRKKHESGEHVISGADVQQLTDILAGRVPTGQTPSGAGGGEQDPRGQVSQHCPECGFANAEGANYCQRCGAYLATERAAGGRDDRDLPRRRDRRVRAGRSRRRRRAGAGARHPLRRRAGGRDLPARAAIA